MGDEERVRQQVLTVPIDVIGWKDAEARIAFWAQRRQSRYVCICNVHSVVTANEDKAFGKVIRDADLSTPDGMPVAWMLRAFGFPKQARINGPDLFWRLCNLLSGNDISIFLYGGSSETQARLYGQLTRSFPSLGVAGLISPPFRELSNEEDAADVRAINDSGAGIVFVSLGCPKQERWMASHRGRINAVMIGVGAAFDYHAGTLKRAPVWMRNSGLEWLFRLAAEPRRLWKRYLVTNSIFALGAMMQLFLHGRKGGHQNTCFSDRRPE